MKQMKILILTNYASTYGGNFIPSVDAFAKYSIAKGDGVGFALDIKADSRTWCRELKKSYPIYFVKNKGLLKDAAELNRYIKENAYDCVYSHFSYFNLACMLSLINPSLAFICHKHTDIGSELTFKRKVRISIKKNLIYRNMFIIFVSKRLQKLELMENAKNSIWLPNALVTARFDKWSRGKYRQETRISLGIDAGAPVILMFGWHKYVKGVDIALKAFSGLLSVRPDARLMIVTSLTEGKEGVRRFAKGIVDDAVLEKVIFLPPSQEVEKYHAAADIFLSSSRSEGFSYSILEALYLGERVVTSDLEGVRWSGKYKTVEFFPSENSEKCVEKLNKSIEELNCKQEEITETSMEVEQDYGIEEWAENVYKVVFEQWHKKRG